MKDFKEEKRKINNLIVEYVQEHDFETNSDFYYAALGYSFEDAMEIAINIILKEGAYIDPEIYNNIQIMIGCEGSRYTAGTIQKYINSTDDEYLIALLEDLRSILVEKYETLGIQFIMLPQNRTAV